MTNLNLTTPELDDIPEDDEAEARTAHTLHQATAEDVDTESDEVEDDPQEVDIEDDELEDDA